MNKAKLETLVIARAYTTMDALSAATLAKTLRRFAPAELGDAAWRAAIDTAIADLQDRGVMDARHRLRDRDVLDRCGRGDRDRAADRHAVALQRRRDPVHRGVEPRVVEHAVAGDQRGVVRPELRVRVNQRGDRPAVLREHVFDHARIISMLQNYPTATRRKVRRSDGIRLPTTHRLRERKGSRMR